MNRTPVIDRIMAKVTEDENGCWIYPGSAEGRGYRRIHSGGSEGRSVMVHRATYEYFISEIPAGLVIDHLCRNPSCCNPWHLEPVTNRVNLMRGFSPSAIAAKATECINGHPFDEQNTYRNPNDGKRTCRACSRAITRARRARLKESA